MSDALNYLVKARPEAMTSYLKFLKETGKSLDPKTRALITVITKVATQTENGFRQYLVRALGLTKIVWATEVLLDMDLPEFRAENLGAEKRWHELKSATDIPDGQVSYCGADGRSLFVYREKNEFRVYDSRCPHQVTNIPHLALEGFRLTCPKHQWSFDIKTGECVAKGNRPLKHFDAKVENGKLLAYW